MRSKIYLSTSFLLLFLWASLSAFSQTVKLDDTKTPVGFHKSKKLSDIVLTPPSLRDRSWKEKVIPNKQGFLEEFSNPAELTGPDPALQYEMSTNKSSATVGENFPGIPNLSGVAPPDTDGDVGPNHYVQMVNSTMQIWDKNGNSLYGPADIITLWDGFSGPWSSTNDGDPIVLYDEYSDRWIASQFSLPNYPSGPFYELIAVSETGDPTGAWFQYAYEFSNMPDYPKFGVWPDGYYFTINQFAPPSLSYAGGAVCVLDRAAMINGDANAEMLFFNLGTSYGSLLPADADGPNQPGAGSPNYLMNLGTNSLRIWEVDVDWTNTSNSSVSLVKTVSTQSYSYSGITINQPGTSQTLDALASRLMYRLQYRNFGSYEVMLTNHTVNADGSGQGGVRWYELRNNGSGWNIYQQGTFAPADGDNRWMGSVAMNGNGDIGVGYSVSGSSTYPSIRFAGQLAVNSGSGILDVNETSIIEGTIAQTGVNRWGDYSMMSIDPSDDQTFWYTTEYSNGGWNWRTQIASFSFEPPVIIAPVAQFSGNPTAIMEGQTVSFTDQSANNPTSWSWSFPGGSPTTSTEKNPVITYPTIGTYDVSLTVTNTAGSNNSTKPNYIDVSEYVISYCNSSGNSTASEWIQSLTLGNYTNNSGSNSGYGDFTSPSISVESGTALNFILTPGFSDRSRREYTRVWIDYNMDGDFIDAGEEVFAANAKKSTVSGIINIPSDLSGETRMRVSMKYNAIPSSCETFSYGEVEDYTLVFGTPVPLAPIAGFSGTPTTVAEGNTVQFTDESLNEPTSWSWSFAGGTPSSSTVQNPAITYAIEGSYEVSLTVSNNEGNDTKTISGYITVTAGGTGAYCESTSASNALEWISQVSIASFNNASGASLYSDFTNLTVGLAPGSTNTVTVTPFYTGKTQREFWRIWIDFNVDGDFEDLGEEVFVGNNKRDTFTGSMIIPSGASGQTRMRVSMKNGGAPSPCESFSNGEVEDYNVNFGNRSIIMESSDVLEMSIYPNPVQDLLSVQLATDQKMINIKIYDAMGRILEDYDVKSKNIQVDLSTYANGLYYIGADDGVQTTLKKFIKN